MNDYIQIKGARVNNLKNISLNIPRGKLVVIAGVSGSGKSSLALIHSMQKANAVMWRVCRAMPVSSLDA